MSRDIWRRIIINTWDVLVEAVALVEAMLLAAVLAHRVLVTTVTTQQLGGDGLYSGGDVERWFSLGAGHCRPTISDHVAEGCQSILIAKLNIGNCVVWFHDGSRLFVWEFPDLVLIIKVPALVNRMIGSSIKPLLLPTLVAP